MSIWIRRSLQHGIVNLSTSLCDSLYIHQRAGLYQSTDVCFVYEAGSKEQ